MNTKDDKLMLEPLKNKDGPVIYKFMGQILDLIKRRQKRLNESQIEKKNEKKNDDEEKKKVKRNRLVTKKK